MAKIDVLSLTLGVLLSTVVSGIYEFVFYMLQGPDKASEAMSAFTATIITLAIFVCYGIFFFILIKKKESQKKT